MLTTRELTTGERLLIERRREFWNQTHAADYYNVSEWQYRQCESDVSDVLAPPALGRMKDHEACMLMRRRKGLKRDELAAKMGISSWWLTQMERGQVTDARLVDYWS